LTALWTAGEKGEPIVRLLGDCAIALPVRTFEVEPGVIIGLLPVVLVRSGFAGISTWRSTGRSIGSSGEPGVLVDGGHGGAGGLSGGCAVRGEGSALGASGISSTFGSVGFEFVTSVSSISTSSIVGEGVVSFAGVGSRGMMSTAGPVEVSITE
jgi:hypothetical protein